jgi:type IV pilus assembly protein PilN
MIRINLLGVERTKTRKLPTFTIQAQQLTIACSLVLVASAAGVGWWFWTLRQTAAQVETDIATAQQEQLRLQSVLAEVRQFESRREQLQQRVQLIEQLRAGQTLPVQLLDHVSRSVPEMLWLVDMEQKGDVLTIQGRANTLPAVSDFVANLGESPILTKPLDLADTQVETLQAIQGQPGIELYKFTVKASIDPAAAAKVQPATPGGAPAAPGGGGGGAAAR